MVDVTTQHFRKLARIMSSFATIYSEMAGEIIALLLFFALLFSSDDTPTVSKSFDKSLGKVPETAVPFEGENERTCLKRGGLAGSSILQIGGSDPEEMADSVRMAKSIGWKRFNINCGCPSSSVVVTEKGKKRKYGSLILLLILLLIILLIALLLIIQNSPKAFSFGAVLLNHPELVRDVSSAMIESLSPRGCDGDEENRHSLTIKMRIGVDDNDSYENLFNFVSIVSQGGINHFVVHARKALMVGF